MRDEAAKEAVKQLVPVLDLFEELEAKFAGVTDEASLKVGMVAWMVVYMRPTPPPTSPSSSSEHSFPPQFHTHDPYLRHRC